MKSRLLLAIIFFGLLITSLAQNNSLSGIVRYYNYWNTPMDDSTTVYLMQGSSAIYQTTVDINGHYLFTGIQAGNYTLMASSTKITGSINMVDALIVMVGSSSGFPPYITGIKLKAADVNGNGFANTVDALAISRFFVGQISNFMPPNVPLPGNNKWISETFTIQIQANSTYTQDLKMICTGDVNGSFIPY